MMMRAISFVSFAYVALTSVSNVSAEVDYDAQEQVFCTGVEFASCSPDDLKFVAESLESTYNALYGPNWYLYNTHYDHIIGGPSMEETEGASTSMKRRLQNNGFGGIGDGGCNLCGAMDDDATTVESSPFPAAVNAQKWNVAFALALKKSGRACLKDVTTCDVSVDFTEKKTTKTMEEEEIQSSILVHCQNVDWDLLTPSEQTFVANNLQKVYQENNGNDNKATMAANTKIQNVQFIGVGPVMNKKSSLMDAMFGLASADRVGYFEGTSIRATTSSKEKKKNAKFLRTAALDAPSDKAFEDLLHEGPYSALSRATDCYITIVEMM